MSVQQKISTRVILSGLSTQKNTKQDQFKLQYIVSSEFVRPLGSCRPQLLSSIYLFRGRNVEQLRALRGGLRLQQYFYRWYFKLHRYFTLNLTFHYIYFSANSILPHLMANLTVFDCEYQVDRLLTCFDEDRFIMHGKRISDCMPLSSVSCLNPQFDESKSQYTFTYFGRHSQTVVYSRCQNVGIVADMQPYVVHDTLMSFSILDKNLLKSIPLDGANGTMGFGFQFQVTQIIRSYDREFFEVFRVVVSKLKTIQVSLPKEHIFKVRVINGPGILSADAPGIHVLDTVQYRTTLFHCVIHTVNFNSSILISSIPVDFTSSIKSLKAGKMDEIMFPGFCVTQQKCYVEVMTSQAFMIKVTTRDFQHTGHNNSKACLLSGFTVFEKGNEISSHCVRPHLSLQGPSLNIEKVVFQPIYSRGNELNLIMYMFPEYVNISLKVIIESAKFCIVRKINICEIMSKYSPFHSMHFIKKLPKTESCIVVQLTYNMDDKYSSKAVGRCYLYIIPRIRDTMDMRMNATGFLTGLYHQVEDSFDLALILLQQPLQFA